MIASGPKISLSLPFLPSLPSPPYLPSLHPSLLPFSPLSLLHLNRNNPPLSLHLFSHPLLFLSLSFISSLSPFFSLFSPVLLIFPSSLSHTLSHSLFSSLYPYLFHYSFVFITFFLFSLFVSFPFFFVSYFVFYSLPPPPSLSQFPS